MRFITRTNGAWQGQRVRRLIVNLTRYLEGALPPDVLPALPAELRVLARLIEGERGGPR